MGLVVFAGFLHDTVQQPDTVVECAQEGFLLLFYHALYQVGLSGEFGVSVAHLLDQRIDQTIERGFLQTKERIYITDGAAQDASDHITGFGVAGELRIGNRECDGAHMVGCDAHGDVYLFVSTVFLARQL